MTETVAAIIRIVVNTQALFTLAILGVAIAYYWRHPLFKHIAPVSVSYAMLVLSLTAGINQLLPSNISVARVTWTLIAFGIGDYGMLELFSYRARTNKLQVHGAFLTEFRDSMDWRDWVVKKLESMENLSRDDASRLASLDELIRLKLKNGGNGSPK